MTCRVFLLAAVIALRVRSAPTAGTQLPPINATTYAALQASVVAAFNLTAAYGIQCAGTGLPFSGGCDVGDAIAGMVRLAFHDAGGAGGPYGNGGPNGCLDWTTGDNANLLDIFTTLSFARGNSSVGHLVSMADYIVLAATTALQYATTVSPASNAAICSALQLDCSISPLVLPFATGRIDVASCPGDAAYLPSPSWTWPQINALFGVNMSMTTAEIVAIMGAHSLGRVMSAGAVSGVTGGWIAAQSSFSNLYHQMVFNAQAPWKLAPNPAPSKDVWLTAQTVTVGNVTTKTGIIALRTDAELGINTTDSTGNTTCIGFGVAMRAVKGSVCPARATGQAIFADYIASPTLFYRNFTTAWAKLTGFRYTASDLTAVGAQVVTPTNTISATPTSSLGSSASPSSSNAATSTATPSGTTSRTPSVSTSATSTLSGSGTLTASSSAAVTRSPTRSASRPSTLTPSASVTPSRSTSLSTTPGSTVTPSSTPSLSVSGTLTASPTSTASPSTSQTVIPSSTSSTSLTASPSLSISGTASSSFTAQSTATSTITGSSSGSPTSTLSASVSISSSTSNSASITQSRTPSATASTTSSASLTTTGTATLTPTRTVSATSTSSGSAAATTSSTASQSPTQTRSSSAALTATVTAAQTPPGTASVTAVSTGSGTASRTRGSTLTGTPSLTHSLSAVASATATHTATVTRTTSPTSSATHSATPSTTRVTPTVTAPPTGSITRSHTIGVSASSTRTGSPTSSRSV